MSKWADPHWRVGQVRPVASESNRLGNHKNNHRNNGGGKKGEQLGKRLHVSET
ncbi:MAG: hypothetical protein AAGK78_00850 [Planctomycetota bacterium]